MVKGRLAAHVLQLTKDVHVKVGFSYRAREDFGYVWPMSINWCGFKETLLGPFIPKYLQKKYKVEGLDFFNSLFDSEFVKFCARREK